MRADNDNCWCHKDKAPEDVQRLKAQGHDAECVHDDDEDDEPEERMIQWKLC